MQVVILLGAPGAGKGTVASGIVNAAGFHHVSTGACFRDAMRNPASELGAAFNLNLNAGDYYVHITGVGNGDAAQNKPTKGAAHG